MNILIYGGNGWIGTQIIQYMTKNNIKYVAGNARADNYDGIEQEIKNTKPTHILSVLGRTHGYHKGKKINTIDYLENDGKLRENINDNLYSPLVLARLSELYKIHFVYIGTGCIFEYDSLHLFGEKTNGFTELDVPNFFGSSYSVVKGFTDNIMKLFPNTLNLRVRMPVTNENNPRNFITKIISYEKICSIPNSITVLPVMIPVLIKMMEQNVKGTYNFTSPGLITHNEILEMYREIVDNNFTWKNFTIEEQNNILQSKRSNNYLDTTKLENFCEIANVKDSVRWCLNNWKK